IRVYTGSQPFAGTNAVVQMSLISNTIGTTLITLNGGFGKGTIRTFYRTVVNICPLKTIYIRHNNAGSSPNWYLRYIRVYNRAAGVNYYCSCWAWLWSNNLSRSLTCV
ncbi:hypothetical protein LSAT2_002723, partial [Lamellibrachia satsuma]